MKRNKTQTEKTSESCRCVLCIAVIAVLAMFASCQRPDPEPEPPAPPVVDTDTLPTNKFVGTWVLCAMNSVDDEPPATCDLANATTDTLVFVDDSTLIHKHSEKSFEYTYEYTDLFLIVFSPTYCNRYFFRTNDQELILRGNLRNLGYRKNFCFLRVY